MPKKSAIQRVGVLAIPPVTNFDLAIPDLIFGSVEVEGRPGYEVTVGTTHPGRITSAGHLDVVIEDDLSVLGDVDTLIVTGTGTHDRYEEMTLDVLRHAAARGARIASLCTGSFALAEAGLLDGRAATTYWTFGEEFARRYPGVDLRPGVLYVDDGDILTSAGVAAALDLCLHLVRLDHGAAVANHAARLAVIAPLRHGGQQQFIETPIAPTRDTSLADVRAWALMRLGEDITVTDLAGRASMSVRHLTRRFRAETGETPLQWLIHQRVEHARELLETTMHSIDQVASLSGLGTGESLRQHFTRRVGPTPSAYRAAFGSVESTGSPPVQVPGLDHGQGARRARRAVPHPPT